MRTEIQPTIKPRVTLIRPADPKDVSSTETREPLHYSAIANSLRYKVDWKDADKCIISRDAILKLLDNGCQLESTGALRVVELLRLDKTNPSHQKYIKQILQLDKSKFCLSLDEYDVRAIKLGTDHYSKQTGKKVTMTNLIMRAVKNLMIAKPVFNLQDND